MGLNIAVPIGLLIWFAGPDALVARDIFDVTAILRLLTISTRSSWRWLRLSDSPARRLPAYAKTSCASIKDNLILRPGVMPRSRVRLLHYGCRGTVGRWTQLCCWHCFLRMRSAHSTALRLILEEHYAPTSLAHRLATLTLATGLVRDTPAQLLLTHSSNTETTHQWAALLMLPDFLHSRVRYLSARAALSRAACRARRSTPTAWKRASVCFTSAPMAHVRD